ncbi:hypothetical protein [Cloacibacillus porcorum]|uniref:hypothetical protein n=1 Tax=Cloacibacillus porcorum TaxID=1197717 RepID=UPI003F01CD3F
MDKDIENKRSAARKWMIGVAIFIVLIAGGGFVLTKMNFLGEFVQGKVEEAAEKQLNLKVTMSPLQGNPVTGFTASNVEISRSGDKLLFIRNIGVDISLPSVLSGSPRVSLIGLDGVDTSLKALQELMPKSEKKSDGPTDIPIDTVMISDSTLRTEWGSINFKPSRIRIKNSLNYDLDVKGTVESKDFSVSGSIGKSQGVWRADNFSAALEDGGVSLSGALYPSMDMQISLEALNLTTVADLVPALERYGVRGVLSGSAKISGSGKDIVTEGSGSLHHAVIRGIPLEEVQTKWSYRPGEISVEVGQGKIFDSSLSGSFSLNTTSADSYLTLKADVKNLKFADWTAQFEKETAGRALFLKGSITSLSADLKGPLNALVGRIEMAPSNLSYQDIALNGLHGSAVFNGQPAGVLDMSATTGGRALALKGRLSFGEKVPTDLAFSTEGFPVEKILKSLPQTENVKVSGSVSLKGSCKGLIGHWVIGAEAASPLITADKVGKVSDISISASYSMGDKKVSLLKSSAEWNGARITAKGTAAFAASADKQLSFDGTFRNVDAERFYPLISVLKTLDVEGVASGSWSLTGSPKAPVVKASVNTGAARFRDLRLAKLGMNIEYSGNTLSMDPISINAGGGRGTLACNVALPVKRADGTQSPTSWKLDGKVSRVDFSIINGLLKAGEDIGGEVSGTVTAGSAAGGGLDWSFDFTGDNVHWRNFKVQKINGAIEGNPREILIKKADGIFLNGATTGSGRIEMPKDGEPFSGAKLDLVASVKKLNVYELLRRHLPVVRAVQGLIETEIKVSGTVGDPKFDGSGRIAPFRYRGFLLPIVEVQYHGSLKDIVISDAHALLKNGTFKAYGHFYEDENDWRGKFNIRGEKIDMRQFGAYLPESFRSRFGGVADFSMKGDGKLSELTGTGVFSAPKMRLMGIRFENIKAPFFVSQNYIMIEDLNASTNGGTLTGGVGFDLKNSEWGGNLTVLSTDVQMLVKQAAPKLKGSISGLGDLKIRGGGEFGRESTVRAGGALYLHKGEVTSFDVLETAKKFTGGKPLRYDSVQATFTYDGGDLNILPGSQATAPKNDPLYRYVMLDGYISRKEDISLFAMGKVNIRALNSLIGAFQGLVSAGLDYTSGQLDKGEVLQSVLGGVLSGFAKNEFRFVTMNIGGTVTAPDFYNVKVQRAVRQNSAKDSIPTSNSDPDEKSLTQDGNTTFRFKFEIPVGPGDGGLGGDAKGQVFEQTLENLLKNVDFGL